MQQSFMKTRPVLPLVLSMSLPMVLSMMVSSLYNIVDSYYVAKISEDAMTALSLVYPVQNLINAVTIGFSIGANAVIAYHLGAQDAKKANAAAAQSILWNVLHGIVLTVVCIAVMPAFLRMFTSDEVIVDMGVRYSRIAFLFSVVIAASMSMEKIFQATGRMMITMVCMMSGCVANIILDPVMIFGWGPFPEMGIEGAALATGIGQALSLVIYLACYAAKMIPIRLHFNREIADPAIAKKMYAVGVPATFSLALPSLLISCLNIILAASSEVYVLVLGVYYKLQTFLYLPANGIVQGMRPIVGYNYGAQRARPRAEDLPHRAGAVGGHHGAGHGAVLDHSRPADRPVLHQCRDHRPGQHRAADHQPGLYHLGGVGHFLRHPGGAGDGRAFPRHFPDAVRGGHPAAGLCL